MKVKVAYTVDIDDVPEVIAGIVTQCREELKNCSRFKFNILKLQQTEEEVHALQGKLSKLSDQLKDCVNMARGYADVHEDSKKDVPDVEEDLLEGENENDA